MEVQSLAISELTPYPENPRKNRSAVTKVADSIKEYGFRQPIVVDEDMVVIAGHTRLEAAKRLNLKQVPVHVAKGLTDAQAKAYRLMDNRSAEDASWDMELLSVEVGDLLSDGFDLALTGFTGDELNDLLSFAADDEGEDEVPEDVEAICKPGDLWILGNHRLKCGDATNATDVEHLLGDVRPHLMVTDPPYGVDFDPTWRKGSEKRTYMGDKPDKEGVWREVWELFSGDVVYIWHADKHMVALYSCLAELGFEFRQQIIWNKMRFIIGRGHYSVNHEPCFYGVRQKKKANWSGSNNQRTMWEIKHLASDTGHGAQKPVECMRRPIQNNSSPGQAIYDPFLGSGTTIIAAETEKRHCYGLELEPSYCDIIIKRWENFTGDKAKREGN